MLLFELIRVCPEIRISPVPELFDELVLFIRRGQFLENRPFVVSDDVGNVLGEPLLVVFLDLFLTPVLCVLTLGVGRCYD